MYTVQCLRLKSGGQNLVPIAKLVVESVLQNSHFIEQGMRSSFKGFVIFVSTRIQGEINQN